MRGLIKRMVRLREERVSVLHLKTLSGGKWGAFSVPLKPTAI